MEVTMDMYSGSLTLGALGLGIMGLSGLGRHGGGHQAAARGGAHAGHHGGGHQGSHAASPSPTHHAGASRATRNVSGGHSQNFVQRATWALLSPRLVFSLLVGFGATGMVGRDLLSGLPLLVLAIVGGLAFERYLVGPVWAFLLRFASEPALTLESCVEDEARAVTNFDRNGQGMISVEFDGQIVQVLGTLRPEDRESGLRVRAGDVLRIDDVDSARNRCTVKPVGV